MPAKQIDPRPYTNAELEAMDFVIDTLFAPQPIVDHGDLQSLCQPHLHIMGRLIAILDDMEESGIDTDDRCIILEKIELCRRNIAHLIESNSGPNMMERYLASIDWPPPRTMSGRPVTHIALTPKVNGNDEANDEASNKGGAA